MGTSVDPAVPGSTSGDLWGGQVVRSGAAVRPGTLALLLHQSSPAGRVGPGGLRQGGRLHPSHPIPSAGGPSARRYLDGLARGAVPRRRPARTSWGSSRSPGSGPATVSRSSARPASRRSTWRRASASSVARSAQRFPIYAGSASMSGSRASPRHAASRTSSMRSGPRPRRRDGITVSRNYAEMRLANLRAVGEAIRSHLARPNSQRLAPRRPPIARLAARSGSQPEAASPFRTSGTEGLLFGEPSARCLRAQEPEVEPAQLDELGRVGPPVDVPLESVRLDRLENRDPGEVLQEHLGHLPVGLAPDLLVDARLRGAAEFVEAWIRASSRGIRPGPRSRHIIPSGSPRLETGSDQKMPLKDFSRAIWARTEASMISTLAVTPMSRHMATMASAMAYRSRPSRPCSGTRSLRPCSRLPSAVAAPGRRRA